MCCSYDEDIKPRVINLTKNKHRDDEDSNFDTSEEGSDIWCSEIDSASEIEEDFDWDQYIYEQCGGIDVTELNKEEDISNILG